MNGGSSKSLLPLVEILISIGIFAIAVVLTLQLFLLARFLGDKTSDTAKAIFEVQNVAENIKTFKTSGDAEIYINDNFKAGTKSMYSLYYDEEWNLTDTIEKASFVMEINMNKDEYNSGELYNFKLEFYKTEPYPFIDDKKTEVNKEYIPLLASADASKFILK